MFGDDARGGYGTLRSWSWRKYVTGDLRDRLPPPLHSLCVLRMDENVITHLPASVICHLPPPSWTFPLEICQHKHFWTRYFITARDVTNANVGTREWDIAVMNLTMLVLEECGRLCKAGLSKQ